MQHIVVTEYPKSGGNWLCNLLGSALDRPKRDIYDVEYNPEHFGRHPWYQDNLGLLPDNAVIKSHELPGSSRLREDSIFIHLIRDGRDVVVSKYFYERDFLIPNGLLSQFDISFELYVELTARSWFEYVNSWRKQSNIITIHYEALLHNTPETLGQLLIDLAMEQPRSKIDLSVSANTMDRMRESFNSTFKYNTFFRKGVAGDWKNVFTKADLAAFNSVCAELMSELGYE